MAQKHILVLESSTERTTVALGADGRLVGQEEVVSNRYSERIIFLIDSLLKKNGLVIKDIYGFGIGLGPGSFTGTRAGISTVRALGQCLRKPVAGISSTDAIAWGLVENGLVRDGQDVFVAIDARRGEIYGCSYTYTSDNIRQNNCLLMSIEDFERYVNESTGLLFAGSAIGLINKGAREFGAGLDLSDERFVQEDFWAPQAKYLIKPISRTIDKFTWENIYNIVPVYWRPSDAKSMAERARQ